MIDCLNEYIKDSENPETNFNLAIEYFLQGQTAAAISFFLRCADRSGDDLDLAYECLIHIGRCFDIQGNRIEHARGMYKNAISILPRRPEAYYMLANFQNWHTQFQDAYFLCKQSFEISDFDSPEFRFKSKYPGIYGLLYEQAVSAWYWGKTEESMSGFENLVDNYWNEMDEHHQNKVLENMGIKYYAEYQTDKYIRETFFEDYSYKGIMVEVGAGPPTFISNSKHFRDSGWRTVSVEPNPKFVQQHIDEGSEVYQYACSDVEEKRDFVVNLNNDEWYTEENDGVSFSALDIRHKNVPEHNSQTTIQVETIRLDNLLQRIGVEHIDILSIDVEGWEIEVLTGLDRNRYQPKVVVLENIENDENYHSYMRDRGYDFVEKRGCNEIYLRNDNQSKFLISSSKNTSWVVDNFYDDPDSVRKFALEQDYHIGGIGRGYIGNRTHQQFLFPGLKEKFEQIMGKKITKWEDHGMNGRFQYCCSGQPRVWHCDSQKWGGMLYLTPDAPFECGTTLYAHKKTRARNYYDDGWDAAWKDTPGDCHLDGTPFEPVDVLGNVYNRLVIFDASCIHSASEYFGTVKENARLWQMFFFDTE